MEHTNNNLGNLPPFYVGQKVVCIISGGSSNGETVIKDKEYTVANVSYFKHPRYKWQGYVVIVVGGVTKFKAERFVPLHEAKFKPMAYSKIIEKELVSVN